MLSLRLRPGDFDAQFFRQPLPDFFTSDYDNSATFVVLAHLSEQNNHPEIARREAERALAMRGGLFWNRLLLASQAEALEPIRL